MSAPILAPIQAKGGFSIIPLDDGRFAVESPNGWIYGARYASADVAAQFVDDRLGFDQGRAIAMRCRQSADEVTFGKTYLCVPWRKSHSTHVKTVLVYIPNRKRKVVDGFTAIELPAVLFEPVNAKYRRRFIHTAATGPDADSNVVPLRAA